MAEIQPFELFGRDLRKMLRHLYDPAELRKCSLLPLFTDEKANDPAATLRRILMDAIQKLNPGPKTSIQANSRRIYDALRYRYIEQIPPKEVANTLGISVRQLQRLILDAEQTLADYLWSQYHLESKMENFYSLLAAPIAEDEIDPGEDETPQLEQELQWLKDSFPNEVINVAEVISNIRRTIKPLVQSLNVKTEWLLDENLPPVTGQVSPLRQGLLNLIIAGMRSVPDGSIKVRVGIESQATRIDLEANKSQASSPGVENDISDNLLMARQMIEVMEGQFELWQPKNQDIVLSAKVLLPLADRLPILVIDDNTDTLRLIQRYLSGTRYQFIGTPNPEQAMKMIQSQQPKAIILDVMLPGMDDWEMLGRLREHLITRETPIIVCTILPLQELALSLGADGFIRKPLSRGILLGELDLQMSRLLKGSQ